MSHDIALLVDTFTTNLAFVTMNWRNLLGRPTITLVATQQYLGKLLPETFVLISMY